MQRPSFCLHCSPLAEVPAPAAKGARLDTNHPRWPSKNLTRRFQSLWADGSRLYFNEEVNGGWRIAQVSALGGETLPFSTSIPTPVMISMDPNRSELLVQSWVSTETFPPIWVVPILGGTPRRFGKVQATDGAFSPDGSHIVYAAGSDIYHRPILTELKSASY